ncbi:MAG: 50S ribosomal protein L13 [Cyanobacteria bacterium SZAS-4]|nr:50S ribosomal protein L13 [Cyanobacteria bacterium SZAS-4]
MNTPSPKAEDIPRTWHLIDAEGQILGRLATEVAGILRGKNKPEFTPHVDCGDFVIIINAEKIKVSGKKEVQKIYHRHSGFPGGHKQESLQALRQRRPVAVLEKAIKGMIPHTRLGDHQFTKLNVYEGPNHPHEAQQPKPYTLVG